MRNAGTWAGMRKGVDRVDVEYLQRILTSRVYDVAHETSLQHASRLSRRLGNQVYLKREDLQPIFSFKLRGAYNHMAHLSRMCSKTRAPSRSRPEPLPLPD